MVKAKKSELTKSLEKRWRVLSRAVERQRRRAVAALAMYEEARNEHYRLVKSKDWALGTCLLHAYRPFPRISDIMDIERAIVGTEVAGWLVSHSRPTGLHIAYKPEAINSKALADALVRHLQIGDGPLAQAIRGVANQA